MKNLKIVFALAGLMGGSLATMAQTPEILEASRYVRGATMAFARMSVRPNGATITERGFCYAENVVPTVADSRTTLAEGLNNGGGPIYWLKNLKPATKYYMRGYLLTADGQTVYGDPVKFYTLPKGQITFDMRDGGDQATYNRIKNATQTAIDWWNNLTEMKGFRPSVGFVDGTPTADCSYGGWIRVGSNQSYQRTGTIMHEMLHGCGVIPWANTEWSRVGRLRSGVTGDGYGTGQWLGDRVTEVLRFWDNNNTEVLNGDYQHMWPYGINGAGEDTGSDILYIGNSLVCQALGEDGLQHTYSLFAEPYYALDQEDDVKLYIKNESADRGRYTSYLMPNASGALYWVQMTAEQALQNDSAAWLTTFTPDNQYYQMRNVATGRYITYTGTNFSTVQRTAPTASDNLQLMKGRVDVDGQRGYWIISPEANWEPKCLQAYPTGRASAATFDISNAAEAQRWLIMTGEEMKAANDQAIASLQKEAADVLKRLKAMADVPHSEETAGADAAFAASLGELETRVAQAASPLELIALMDEAQAAGLEFLKGVSPTNAGRPFDLTYLITNPGFDTNTDGWSQSASVSYSCAEFFQTAFDFNQTLQNLPAGNYRVNMQGFQRPGSSADSYAAYTSGTNAVNAELYAAENASKLAHIASGAQTRKVGGTESTVGSGRYIPNNMEAASLYFKKGLYENSVFGTVGADGVLKLGVRSQSMPGNYWVIFDNFRLYYFGKLTEESVLGLNGVNANAAKGRQVYSLDGRRVASDAGLRPGIYIVNGQKMVVK
ncbi:MAG: hypothetical protein IJ841_02340 [Prevotella sp.]|nr:hypothetical protein [Prevotella sp.]